MALASQFAPGILGRHAGSLPDQKGEPQKGRRQNGALVIRWQEKEKTTRTLEKEEKKRRKPGERAPRSASKCEQRGRGQRERQHDAVLWGAVKQTHRRKPPTRQRQLRPQRALLPARLARGVEWGRRSTLRPASSERRRLVRGPFQIYLAPRSSGRPRASRRSTPEFSRRHPSIRASISGSVERQRAVEIGPYLHRILTEMCSAAAAGPPRAARSCPSLGVALSRTTRKKAFLAKERVRDTGSAKARVQLAPRLDTPPLLLSLSLSSRLSGLLERSHGSECAVLLWAVTLFLLSWLPLCRRLVIGS